MCGTSISGITAGLRWKKYRGIWLKSMLFSSFWDFFPCFVRYLGLFPLVVTVLHHCERFSIHSRPRPSNFWTLYSPYSNLIPPSYYSNSQQTPFCDIGTLHALYLIVSIDNLDSFSRFWTGLSNQGTDLLRHWMGKPYNFLLLFLAPASLPHLPTI